MIDKERQNIGRFEEVICDLDSLVPKNHIIRKIDRAIDWDGIYNKVREFYCIGKGRPGINPVVLIKIALIEHIFHINSLRQTVRDIEINLAYRWFIGYSMTQKIPHFSTVSCNFINRIDPGVFEEIFIGMIDRIASKKIIAPQDIIYESAYLKSGESLIHLAEKYGISEWGSAQLSLNIEELNKKDDIPQAEQIEINV